MQYLEDTLAYRAATKVFEVEALLRESKASQKEKENDLFALDVNKMIRLHTVYVIFKISRQSIEAFPWVDMNAKRLPLTCLRIFALHHLRLDNQSLYESGYLGAGSGKLLNAAYNEALKTLRPQMIPMLEVWDVAQGHLPTTIGNAHGDIYEMQFETAKNSSLNSAIVPSFFETHMKPVMTMFKPAVPKL